MDLRGRGQSPPFTCLGSATWPKTPGPQYSPPRVCLSAWASHWRVGEAQQSRTLLGRTLAKEGAPSPSSHTHPPVLAEDLAELQNVNWRWQPWRPGRRDRRRESVEEQWQMAAALGASVRNGHRADPEVGWIGPECPTHFNCSARCGVHAAEVGLQRGEPQLSFLPEPLGPFPYHSSLFLFLISSLPLLISEFSFSGDSRAASALPTPHPRGKLSKSSAQDLYTCFLNGVISLLTCKGVKEMLRKFMRS